MTLVVISVALAGCGPVVGVPPSPGPTPPRNVPVDSPPTPAPRVESAPVLIGGPEPRVASVDPILDSPWAQHPEMDVKVQAWVRSFQTREASVFRETLVRKGQYRDVVNGELRARNMHRSLASLPIVESWYNPKAVSWVGAAGLWQFMPPTARGLGLKVDRLVDERRDPFLSTPLALTYLQEMYDRFGSWFLALAAYNGGPGRLERILRGRDEDELGHDGVFLGILAELPRETQDFVPRFLAAALIDRDPEAFGFEGVTPEEPIRFDEVRVPDATSLDVVAGAAGVDLQAVEALNPQLLRGLTPAGVSTSIRLPPGAGDQFATAFPLIPPEEWVTFVEHSVVQGETLTHIAQFYGVPVGDLQAANPTIQPRRMQIGQRVVVPKAPSVRDQLRRGGVVAEEGGEERLHLYRIQAGDTLSGIAARHRVGVGDLLRWNDLSRDAIIFPGNQLKIYLPGG